MDLFKPLKNSTCDMLNIAGTKQSVDKTVIERTPHHTTPPRKSAYTNRRKTREKSSEETRDSVSNKNYPSESNAQKNAGKCQKRLPTFVQTMSKIQNSLSFCSRCYTWDCSAFLVQIFSDMVMLDVPGPVFYIVFRQ